MNDLNTLTDEAIIEATDKLVAREREVLISVLEHLREIERRRLFSALGYTSLWDYAVKRLKYSEDQAYRRISAMRLVRELPEIEEKIETGALSLSNLSMAQSLFRSEEKLTKKRLDPEQKSSLLKKLENKSKREAEQIVINESSQPMALKPDQVRAVSDEMARVEFIADQALLEKIERLKGLLAHSHPELSLAELMHKLCDLGLDKFDPARKVKRPASPAPGKVPAPALSRRYISAKLKRDVWQKHGSQCAKCGSRRALQIEHIHPVALGGGNEPKNLTLLCRPCNQRSAVEKIGIAKMESYFGPGLQG